jgi:uncharacterized protein YodC (DUF2158 family)
VKSFAAACFMLLSAPAWADAPDIRPSETVPGGGGAMILSDAEMDGMVAGRNIVRAVSRMDLSSGAATKQARRMMYNPETITRTRNVE